MLKLPLLKINKVVFERKSKKLLLHLTYGMITKAHYSHMVDYYGSMQGVEIVNSFRSGNKQGGVEVKLNPNSDAYKKAFSLLKNIGRI